MVKKIVSLTCVLLMFGSLMVSAKSNDSNNSKEKIEIEIMVNEDGKDYLENLVFEDGTRITDYDYTVRYVSLPKNFYPISTYFSYAAWIVRDGVRSLSVNPKPPVRMYPVKRDEAWNVLSHPRQGFGSSVYWKNTQVMKWQFNCHYSFADNKEYWNLEPHRTAGSYAQVVASGCNP